MIRPLCVPNHKLPEVSSSTCRTVEPLKISGYNLMNEFFLGLYTATPPPCTVIRKSPDLLLRVISHKVIFSAFFPMKEGKGIGWIFLRYQPKPAPPQQPIKILPSGISSTA